MIPLDSGGRTCPACPVQGMEGLRQKGMLWNSGLAASQEELVCHTSPEQTFSFREWVTLQFSYDPIMLPGIFLN